MQFGRKSEGQRTRHPEFEAGTIFEILGNSSGSKTKSEA
jgi:hypothetical protein